MWGLGRQRCRWPTAWSRCWLMARRALSTQGSRGAPKGACREETGVRGDTSCRRHLEEGAGWGLCGAGPGQGTAKGALWGRETWLCPHCCFLSPPQQGRNKSPRPRRVVLLGEGAGTGSIRCLHQPLPPQGHLHRAPRPKARPDPLHLGLKKTEPVAWHHLDSTSQLHPLWEAGRDLLISSARHGWQPAAAAHGSASPGWSNQRAAGMHRQVSAEFLCDFKYISKATSTAPKCCRHSRADK